MNRIWSPQSCEWSLNRLTTALRRLLRFHDERRERSSSINVRVKAKQSSATIASMIRRRCNLEMGLKDVRGNRCRGNAVRSFGGGGAREFQQISRPPAKNPKRKYWTGINTAKAFQRRSAKYLPSWESGSEATDYFSGAEDLSRPENFRGFAEEKGFPTTSSDPPLPARTAGRAEMENGNVYFSVYF